MLKLFLLRHGKAQNPIQGQDDYDRSLNRKGVVQINQIGAYFNSTDFKVEQIISSKAKRTFETAEIMNHYLKVQDVEYSKELYLADEHVILEHLQTHAKANQVLYVGHNFGISNIASLFAGSSFSLTTGMLIEFQFDVENWKAIDFGKGKLGLIKAPNVYLP